MADAGSLIFSALGVGEGVPAAMAAWRAFRKGGGIARHPSADLAYIAYQAASTEFLVNLQLIVGIGVPPSFAGGLWTYPIVLRAHQRMVDSATQAAVAFGQIVMLGSDEVAEAAFEVGLALGAAGSGIEINQRRIKRTPEFDRKINVVSEALRTYLLAVRSDLELPAPARNEIDEESGETAQPS